MTGKLVVARGPLTSLWMVGTGRLFSVPAGASNLLSHCGVLAYCPAHQVIPNIPLCCVFGF